MANSTETAIQMETTGEGEQTGDSLPPKLVQTTQTVHENAQSSVHNAQNSATVTNPLASTATGNAGGMSKSQKRNMRRKKAIEIAIAEGKEIIPRKKKGDKAAGLDGSSKSNLANAAKSQSQAHRPVDTPVGQALKRSRVTGDTPPEQSGRFKRKDHKITPQQTMAQVVVNAHLTMAIVHAPEQGAFAPLTPQNFSNIFEQINLMMFENVEKNLQLPCFDETRLTRGVVKVVCGSEYSKTWLIMNASKLSEMLKMRLEVCEFDKIPKPTLFLAFFPHFQKDDDSILRMLNACNPSLPNIVWTVSRRKVLANGTHLLIRVDEPNANIISKHEQSMRFGMGIARFRRIIPKVKFTAKTDEATLVEKEDFSDIGISENEFNTSITLTDGEKETLSKRKAKATANTLSNSDAPTSEIDDLPPSDEDLNSETNQVSSGLKILNQGSE